MLRNYFTFVVCLLPANIFAFAVGLEFWIVLSLVLLASVGAQIATHICDNQKT